MITVSNDRTAKEVTAGLVQPLHLRNQGTVSHGTIPGSMGTLAPEELSRYGDDSCARRSGANQRT